MTKDEALKRALEALLWANEEINGWMDDAQGLDPVDHPEIMSAITAIKEALAQPEQDVKCKYCTDGCPACDARKLPEQEPVAWADHGVVNWIADKQFKHASLLYTTPPQHTWVGLKDDDEIDWDGGDLKSFVKAIEAKLKEKNR